MKIITARKKKKPKIKTKRVKKKNRIQGFDGTALPSLLSKDFPKGRAARKFEISDGRR